MRWISKFIVKLTSSTPPLPPVDMGPSFANQIRWESEGKTAGFAGKTSTDCPYEPGTNAWNHWIYGRDMATAPKMVHLDGSDMWFSTAPVNSSKIPDHLLKYPDGRVTTPDGRPVSFRKVVS